MSRIFLQFESISDKTIKAKLESNSVPGVGPGLPADFIEVTSTSFPSGITSWDQVVGYAYNEGDGSFTAPPAPAPTKRDQLKAKPKATWTTEDIAEALQELL